MRRIVSKIAGITYNNYNGTNRQLILQRCHTGERLSLEREPDNQYDSNAIGVCRENGEQLGFLNQNLASQLAPELDRGYNSIVELTEITGASHDIRGANIKILIFPHGDSSKYNEWLLFTSVSEGNAEKVKEAVQNGVNVNTTDRLGRTALMYAATRNTDVIGRILIDNGANVNIIAHNSASPLMYAAANGHRRMTGILIDNGAEIEYGDASGFTSFQLAAGNGHAKAAEYLIERGAAGKVDIIPVHTEVPLPAAKKLEIIEYPDKKIDDIISSDRTLDDGLSRSNVLDDGLSQSNDLDDDLSTLSTGSLDDNLSDYETYDETYSDSDYSDDYSDGGYSDNHSEGNSDGGPADTGEMDAGIDFGGD